MPRHKYLVKRGPTDLSILLKVGTPENSGLALQAAIDAGSQVIREIQRISRDNKRRWKTINEALRYVDPGGRKLLELRRAAIDASGRGSHHRHGFRMSAWTGSANPRPVNSLCLISGFEGQEIPTLVAYDRVVVDVEHIEQALGPASVDEIFSIRKQIGEYVYVSTNVSESPQIVRSAKTGQVDTRSTAALTASKVVAAIHAGADVIKVGFANLDITKQDMAGAEVSRQMKLVRSFVDKATAQRLLPKPLNDPPRYPLVAVFFPDIGVESNGDRPMEIAHRAIELTSKAKWQGILIDTFEKHAGRRYRDYYSENDTLELANTAHHKGIEFWIAGSIRCAEIKPYVKSRVDLICFGGAARHSSGIRKSNDIKRPRVRGLVQEFEEADPREKRG
ncbi:MAG: hypothetical protein HYX75_14115 [Acidobacteria bacterium]|nr:hypothetical protein [Acidobacteriota bacterium]